MDQQTIIADLEARAKAVGLPMSEVCKRANVHPTTFSRWKLSDKNDDPIGATLKSLSAIEEVLREAEMEQSHPKGGEVDPPSATNGRSATESIASSPAEAPVRDAA